VVVIVARPSKKPQPESRADVRAGSKDSGAARGKPGRKKTKKKIAKKAAKKKVAKKRTASRGVEDFARGLAETERIALIVRDELFSGSWENMRKDLEARAAGRPYVFRLASRIDEDLKAVEKLSAFERRRKVNLSEFLREGQ
jgi:hypothetical protein